MSYLIVVWSAIVRLQVRGLSTHRVTPRFFTISNNWRTKRRKIQKHCETMPVKKCSIIREKIQVVKKGKTVCASISCIALQAAADVSSPPDLANEDWSIFKDFKTHQCTLDFDKSFIKHWKLHQSIIIIILLGPSNDLENHGFQNKCFFVFLFSPNYCFNREQTIFII